jgi:U3 small nucleolar RNA-associated protein 13
MTQGLQLVSCASDGLVKVWNIKDEESAATLDNHEEKIWALAISKDEKTIVSGAADSVITIWQDVTKEQEEERLAEQQQTVIQNQDYENFVASQDYKSAILLALSMDNPRRLLALFTSIARSDSKDPGSATGSAAVDLALTSLLPQDLLRLLAHVRDWNTSIKTSDAAQSILHVLLQHYPASHLLALSSHPPEAPKDTLFTDAVVKSRKKTSAAVADILEGLLPYTERHYRRADRMQMQDAWLVDYSLSQMDLILDGPDTRMLVDR